MPWGVCTERGGPPNNTRDFVRETKKAPLTPMSQISREKIKRGPEYSSEPSGYPFFGQSKQINEILWFVGKDVTEALGYSNAKFPILGTRSKLLRRNSSRQNSLVFRPYINSKSFSGKLCQ